MADYSDKSLRDKLGYHDGMSVQLIHAPGDYVREVGIKSAGYNDAESGYDFIHAFYTDKSDFAASAWLLTSKLADDGMLWVSWPKQSSGVKTDLGEQDLRDALLPLGVVDTKVCAVDDTWSALKFVWRKDY